MQNRILGRTQLEVSEIGLGTWQLGGDWGAVDDQTALDILATAVDCGVTFFDTADVYGEGLSEVRIGRFLKACSEPITVATKLGRYPEPGWPDNFSWENFCVHTEASLRRLGVDALDLTQIHCLPTDYLQRDELYEWLGRLKREGKVKHFGFSVESMDEALYCCDRDGVDSLQIIFNVFRQKPIEALFQKARERDIALIIRLPLASGLLSGKFLPDHTFEDDDHRSYNRDGYVFNVGETFCGIPFENGVSLVEGLRGLLPADMTLTQMALRWILDFDAVSAVIPGATGVKQVVENAAVSKVPPLTEAVHAQLDDYYRERVVSHIRGKY